LTFLLGVAAGLTNGTVEDVLPLIVMAGFVKLGVLGWMIARPRRAIQEAPTPAAISPTMAF
jgi:hypothetical protein